jgi:hypothetical protein
MSKVSSLFVGRAVRSGLLAIATALVLVPTVARARQAVEHCETTRLSIKQSWLGVAPPTKASVAPVQVAVLPPPVVQIDHGRLVSFVHAAWSLAPRAVHVDRSDPLRGPPSRLS